MSISPPAPRVYIETYGCAFNVSDGEVMAGLLERDGCEMVPTAAEADAVVVNSCTVKDRTWLDLQRRMGELTTTGDAPKPAAVILAGCAPRVPQQAARFASVSKIGPGNLASLPEVLRRTLQGETVSALANSFEVDRLQMPARRRNARVEIVPISKGCLGQCTFCQTVIARGRLRSFPEEDILRRIQVAVDEGVNQVWLTSQDCGAYGLDVGTNLPKLMRRIARLPGNFKVRVGMANPDLIKLCLPEFVEALTHERFYRFAHVPVQAGSDQVLADMKRLYTADDFRAICDALRTRMPDITLATDIIAGFPTESSTDFEATLTLLQETAVPVVNRSRFSPRAGTAAARMKPLPSHEIAARSKALYQLARQISDRELDQIVGCTEQLWVEETLRAGSQVMARNAAYKAIIAPPPPAAPFPQAAQITARQGFHLLAQWSTNGGT